jgi:hypothetical protein
MMLKQDISEDIQKTRIAFSTASFSNCDSSTLMDNKAVFRA